MTLQLYTLSGSPFGWKVQLALEAKHIPYEISYLSPDRGDLATPWFRKLNPHGKLPVLVDGDLVLFESDAIVDYLADAFPAFGSDLWPRAAAERALARRLAIEASAYLYPSVRTLVMGGLRADAARPLAASDEAARDSIGQHLALFAGRLSGPFFTGDMPGAADFALYPLIALLKRLADRRPDQGFGELVPPAILAWSERIEALPFFETTYPPHWRS